MNKSPPFNTEQKLLYLHNDLKSIKLKKYQRLLVVAVLILWTQSAALAQTDFAPIGATWYHKTGDGVLKTTVKRDTTILGQKCKVVNERAYHSRFPPDIDADINGNLYLYGNADTVFIYNDIRSEFTPLFVFNVSAGDTVSLPVMEPANCARYIGSSPEFMNFSFVVDSVRSILYSGVPLKTVFSHSIRIGSNPLLGWNYYYSNKNVYAEKIGSLQTGLIPVCKDGCGMIPECILVDSIRCYSDSFTNIQFVTDSCDRGIKTTTGIADQNIVPHTISVYPNPSTGTFQLLHAPALQSLQLYDLQGRLLKQWDKPDTQSVFDIAELAPALYLLRINAADNSHLFTKLNYVP
jgi:hypothetical protein